MRGAPLVALALAAAPAPAQTPPRFASEVAFVELDVAVTRDGRPLPGLTAADFELKDAGVPQTVELVARGQARAQAILLLDTSQSVAGEKLRQLGTAGAAFLAGLRADDTATLVAFSYQVRLLGEVGLAPAAAAPALDRLAASGPTALVDAVSAALALADSRRGRPVLLVFSDGDDRVSWLSESHVIDAARKTDVVVHAVGFTPPAPGARDRMLILPNQERRLGGSPGFLERLTRATGGRLWFADAPEGLTAAFQSVLEDLRERYLLRYEPRGVAPGGWHPLEVRVRGSGALVRCRPGYQAVPAPP